MADGGRVTLRGTRPFILLISRSSSADRNRMPLLNAGPLCLSTSLTIERAGPSLELLLPHSPILPSYWKVDPDAVACQARPAIKFSRGLLPFIFLLPPFLVSSTSRQINLVSTRWSLARIRVSPLFYYSFIFPS